MNVADDNSGADSNWNSRWIVNSIRQTVVADGGNWNRAAIQRQVEPDLIMQRPTTFIESLVV